MSKEEAICLYFGENIPVTLDELNTLKWNDRRGYEELVIDVVKALQAKGKEFRCGSNCYPGCTC